jgi:predicted acyltransferase
MIQTTTIQPDKSRAADAVADKTTSRRMVALDAYRGLIMVSLVGSECFEHIRLPDRPFYHAIASQFGHRPWGGADFYDNIMPAFLFMVGVAMSYSISRRIEKGDSRWQLFKHFLKRAFILIVTSEIVISIETNHLHLQFHNILTQVAFTSLICFFIMQLQMRYQLLVAVLLLAGHSALYLFFPGHDGAFQPVTNFGAVLDRFIMGRNYAMAPAVNLNTITETVNVLAGIWAGNLLRSRESHRKKLFWLIGGALGSIVLGLAFSPLVPINKWLWTASFALYTLGWSVLGLALFYLLDTIAGLGRWMFFFVVVGMNSLLVYCIGEILVGWLTHSVEVLTGWLSIMGEFGSITQCTATFMVIWYLTYWLYQKRIFIRA